MNKTKKQEHYFSFKTTTGNQIWTATMPLVWKQIMSTFTSLQPLAFNQPTKQAKTRIKILNESMFDANIIPDDGIYLKCGFGQKTINLINKEIKQKFGNKSPLQEHLGRKDFISYVYICRSLTFFNKFEMRKDRSFRFNGRPVESFYAKRFEQKQQIKCYFYEDRHNFLIQVRLKEVGSTLFLLKSKKVKTVKNAINTVLSSIKSKQPGTLASKDSFEMPFISINGLRRYEQLQGLEFQNKELEGYRVKKMYEQFKLEINSEGAILEAQGVLIAFKCPSKGADHPRQFWLDESFWLVLKQEGLPPYFCALIQSVNNP